MGRGQVRQAIKIVFLTVGFLAWARQGQKSRQFRLKKIGASGNSETPLFL